MSNDKFITRINTSFYIINSRAIHHSTCFHHVNVSQAKFSSCNDNETLTSPDAVLSFPLDSILKQLCSRCLWVEVKYVFRFKCFAPSHSIEYATKHPHSHKHISRMECWRSRSRMLSVTSWTDEKRTEQNRTRQKEKSKPSVIIICSTSVCSVHV